MDSAGRQVGQAAHREPRDGLNPTLGQGLGEVVSRYSHHVVGVVDITLPLLQDSSFLRAIQSRRQLAC